MQFKQLPEFKSSILTIGFFLTFFIADSLAQSPLWMRYPAISPDGKSIVFSNKGNLYKVAASGGTAIPLTLHPAHDYYPVWSKDGEKIAFASNRYGNFDVFVIGKNGGTPKRLSFHSSNDYPSSFSIDNQSVIYSSSRLDDAGNRQFPSSRLPELYEVNVEGGRPKQLITTPALNVSYNADGSKMIFEEVKGYEDAFRKHHVSSIARDLWLLDTKEGAFQQMTQFKGEDRDPVFAANGQDFYYLSEQGGSFNVYKSSINNPSQQQAITNFALHPVRYLSMANDATLCYFFNGNIYTQKEGANPQVVNITILADDLSNPVSIKSVNSGISEMVLSPNGKEIAVIYRGEVFVTAVDGSMTKRITNTPEQERSIDFSPDGKKLVYASERNNSWNLYTVTFEKEEEKYFMNATLLKETVLLESANETFQPQFSPDGKEVAFIEERTQLKVINLESKQQRTILDGSNTFSYADGDQSYNWSPDGKWFLVQFLPNDYWFGEAGLISSDGKSKVINLSKSGFYDFNAQWAKKGEMMIWGTDKNGLHGVAKTGPAETDIYALFFTKQAFEEFKMNKEEYALYKEAKEEREKKEKEVKEKAEKAKKEAEAAKKKKSKKKKGATAPKKKEADKDKIKLDSVKIDWDGLTDRKVRLTIHSSRMSDAKVTHDGKYLLYFSRTEKGYDLWRTNLRDKSTKILTKFGSGGGALHLDKDGKNVYVLSRGKIAKVDIESGKKKSISVAGEMELNENAERAYLFDHVARQVQKKFHDANLHGAAWDTLVADYKKMLPSINNNYDFAELLSELLGELNASHTGGRYWGSSSNGDQTASFGVFYDNSYTGNGLKISEIMPGSPLTKSSDKIVVGTIIEKIDGTLITPNMNYYPLLNRKVGKVLLLSFYNPQNGQRWEEKIKPISLGAENQLCYKRWIQRNREETHRLSNGRIGYMHIRSMGDGSFREFLDDVMGDEVNREAIIVDSRFNGGGDLVDDLTTFLSGKKYMGFKGRDRSIGFESQRRWTKPSIVLMSESNYSDAHCFPAGYKDLEIGKLVGMPVPGTCTFVWWERMQNGVVFGIPNLSVTDIVGDVLENKQLEPDVLVLNEYDKVAKGQDQQLEAAVKELMKELK
jgi:Tol biopolymer transport system component/C-terminal processing protease CtpA/Prc